MSPRPALSRRTALATAALVPVGLAACDIDPPRDEVPTGGVPPTPHADSVLVGEVVTAIAAAEAVVTAARDAAPAVAPTLDALVLTHSRHRELLAEAAPDASAPAAPEGGVPAGRGAALDAVRRVERHLRRDLQRASGQASSGDLARVLAVMVGSLAQHAAALDAATDGRATR